MNARLLIVITLSFFFYSSFAQDDDSIDIYLKQLKNRNTDTALADIYAKLCYRYCTVNADSALWYGNKATQLSVNIHYEKGMADAYNNTGWAYYSKGDLIRAKELLNKALEKFKTIGIDEYTAVPLANLATIYVDESDYSRAISFYTQAYKYLQEAGDNTKAAEMLYSMGRIYNLEKDFAKARSYFQRAYTIHKEQGNEVYMAQALSSIANTYQSEGNYDTALYFYTTTIPVFLKHHDIYRTGNAHENVALAYQSKKKYNQALSHMLLAEKYYTRLNSKIDMAYAYNGLGDIYAHRKNFNLAVLNYKTALSLAIKTTEKNLQQSILSGLSNAYLKLNDYKNAYLLLDSSDRIKDSLFTNDKQKELLKLQTEFETAHKEKENQVLKEKNLVTSLQLERNKLWLISAGTGLLLTIVLLYALYINRKAKIKSIQTLKKLNIKLQEQKEEISRINTILELKALRAQMNPHFIFNCMSSIQECILTGNIEDANTYLTKLSRLLRMVLNYSDDENVLLDKELQMLTLYLQLERMRLKNNFDFNIEIDENIVTEELLVPTLFLQPFAENAVWHGLVNKANNRMLAIKIKIKSGALHFIMTDNGIGRKKSEGLKQEDMHHQSKGIKLIEKRLSIINNKIHTNQASFIIHDLYNNERVATGTSVEITLPLIMI